MSPAAKVWIVREADPAGERHASYYTDESLAKEHLWNAVNGILWRFLRGVQNLEDTELAEFIQPRIDRMNRAIRDVGDALRSGLPYEAYSLWKAFETETQRVFIPPLIKVTGTVFLETR